MRTFIFALLVCFGFSLELSLEAAIPPAFLQQLQGEIQKQQTRLNDTAAQTLSTTTVATTANAYQFQMANDSLQAKKTLYGNFANNPVTQSPLVQAELLKIFQKEMITMGDLAELKSIADSERSKYPSLTPSAAGQ